MATRQSLAPRYSSESERDHETWIEILHPASGAHVPGPEVVFEGKAEPGASVSIGDHRTETTPDGAWRIVLVLEPGWHDMKFWAVDEAGNEAYDRIEIRVGEGDNETWIEILHPAPGAHVDGAEVAFEGLAEPGASVTAYYTGHEADVTGDGAWRIVLALEPGWNDVKFVAEDPFGNVAYAYIEVFRVVADEEHEFTARQQYGSCDEEIPYDVFYGTAVPGTTISVESAFGGGTVVAGDGGHWEIRVEFPPAPLGEAFTVYVSASTGEHVEFSFVRTSPPPPDG